MGGINDNVYYPRRRRRRDGRERFPAWNIPARMSGRCAFSWLSSAPRGGEGTVSGPTETLPVGLTRRETYSAARRMFTRRESKLDVKAITGCTSSRNRIRFSGFRLKARWFPSICRRRRSSDYQAPSFRSPLGSFFQPEEESSRLSPSSVTAGWPVNSNFNPCNFQFYPRVLVCALHSNVQWSFFWTVARRHLDFDCISRESL